jgi:hypothetical protein
MKSQMLVGVVALAALVLATPSHAKPKIEPDDPAAIRAKRPPRQTKRWANKRSKSDKDADAIADSLEASPVAFGAASVTLNPERKNVIIIIDYIGNDGANKPSSEAVALVLSALAEAPVKGKNRKPENRGIACTVLVPSVGYNAPSTAVVGRFLGNEYDWSDLDLVKNDFIARTGMQATPPIYHYCLSCYQFGSSKNFSSGISRNASSPYAAFRAGAVDLILSLQGRQGNAGMADAVAGTVLHEFGHNLGLSHGGYDHVNHKPNYISIMNYNFQFVGIDFGVPSVKRFWYSAFRSKPINENAIKEQRGVGRKGKGYGSRMGSPAKAIYPPSVHKEVDWNLNGIIDRKKYALNLNPDTDRDLTWLVAEDNYKNLNFSGGGLISAAGAALPGAGAGADTALPEPPRYTHAPDCLRCQEFTPEMQLQLEANTAEREAVRLQAQSVPMRIVRTPALTVYTLE